MSFNGSERVYLVNVCGQEFVVRGATTTSRSINVVLRHLSKEATCRRIGAMDVLEMASKGVIPKVIDVDASDDQSGTAQNADANEDNSNEAGEEGPGQTAEDPFNTPVAEEHKTSTQSATPAFVDAEGKPAAFVSPEEQPTFTNTSMSQSGAGRIKDPLHGEQASPVAETSQPLYHGLDNPKITEDKDYASW